MSKQLRFRARGVKRYSVQGVTYTYHVKSGARLPDLPYNDPRFVRALAFAEQQSKIKSRAAERSTTTATHTEVPASKAKIRAADMVAYSLIQCANFVLSASSGSVLIYHSGDLAQESASATTVRDRQQYMLIAAEFDLVSLRQERVSESWYHYYAVRTKEPIRWLPRHVIQADITPDEYRALRALDERQPAVSTTRAIRDELGISDIAAADIRRDFINRGWLDNGRPPEMTALGLSLLT